MLQLPYQLCLLPALIQQPASYQLTRTCLLPEPIEKLLRLGDANPNRWGFLAPTQTT